MGIKPAQVELNVALNPLFMSIENAHLIHDDLILATKTVSEHIQAIRRVMKVVSEAGLTLNPEKCSFANKEINFWGMIFSANGMRPAKVDALEFITAPTNKDDLLSLLCIMQCNSDFIENFTKKAVPLRELTRKNTHFKWKSTQQQCFEELLQSFLKKTLLKYFDTKKKIFVVTDAHATGLRAILLQVDDFESAKPVVTASRTTSNAEH